MPPLSLNIWPAPARAVFVGSAAVMLGALTAVNPIFAIVPVLGIGLVLIGRATTNSRSAFVTLVMLALAGYALAGRGFAYLGPSTIFSGERYAPPYIGELVLAVAVGLLPFTFSRLKPHIVVWAIAAFCIWGALRTI